MTLKKAKLVEIKWDAKQKQAEKVDGGKNVTVQFNPSSLKINFTNKNLGGDQPGGSTKQFVGSGSTKLSVELLFDTTDDGTDVRKHTEDVAFFIKAKTDNGGNSKSNRVPPGISFEWGSFIFRGLMDSMDETLDYFSEDGVPLRATISLSISRQEIEFLPGEAGQGGGGGAPQSIQLTPLQAAPKGKTLQGMAGLNGNSGDWKSIAEANNIDDPLRLSAGALIDVNASASVSVSAGVSLSASASVGASADAGASLQTGAGASASFTAGGLRRR
ncbi:MAG TPA: hypothetical protein VLJ61_00100 [Pyrinomonadaceae bacterium]|nr:hypothetical protein [Pyrinomonadaceae bacterium]